MASALVASVCPVAASVVSSEDAPAEAAGESRAVP